VLQFWWRFRKNRPAVVGLIVVAFFGTMALLAPTLAPVDPLVMGRNSLSGPSFTHLMGTDDLGRDVFSRFLFGARVSLVVGLLAAIASGCIGVLVGSISGYFGGRIDNFLMRLTELFQVMPRFFLALLIVALFGTSLFNIIFVISILSWPPVARLARAEFLSLREREFVEAARSIGLGNRSIIFGEVLPNAIPSLVVIVSLQIATAILLEASLSFLGLGDPAQPSWGLMLNNSQKFLRTGWWMSLFPGIGIFLVVMGFNLFGDGLTDALNPRLKER
jgi:peptide/nickel transport system permease protein